MEHRAICHIAQTVQRDWGDKISIHARSYLNAMLALRTIDEMYYNDTASSVIAYFLSNATSWRGETARRIKAELNQMLKDHRNVR